MIKRCNDEDFLNTFLSSSAVPFVDGGLGVGTIPEVNVIDTRPDDRKKKYTAPGGECQMFFARCFSFSQEKDDLYHFGWTSSIAEVRDYQMRPFVLSEGMF